MRLQWPLPDQRLKRLQTVVCGPKSGGQCRHAPKAVQDELSEGCRDMICAETAADVQTRRKAFLRKWRLKCIRHRARTVYGRLPRGKGVVRLRHVVGRGHACGV